MANEDRVLFLDVDETYGADELGLPYRDLVVEGVVGWVDGDFQVSERAAGANMSVDVAAGQCWIKGDDDAELQPTYRYREPALENLAIATSHPISDRVDLIVAEVLDSSFSGVSKLGQRRVVQGSPGLGEPAVPDNALVLARVDVLAGVTGIFDADITDRRRPAYCGRPQVFTAAQFATLNAAADADAWDGTEIELEADATDGVYWRFRRREASAHSYKWEFVGGADLYEEVETAQTGSGAYGDLATVGPAIAIPVEGEFIVALGCHAALGSAPANTYMSYAIGGSGAVDADSLQNSHSTANITQVMSRERRKGSLTAVTLTAKYKTDAGTGTWSKRWMRVRPVRIG